MKIKITFKTPDVVEDAVREAAGCCFATVEGQTEDVNALLDIMGHANSKEFESHLKHELKHWIKHGEYVTIEFDTVAKTAVVLTTS